MSGISTYSYKTSVPARRQTTFNGVAIPVETIQLHSQGRQHLHEYPHSPGAAPEKLGRGIWYLTVEANFSVTFASHPTSYPGDMLSLFALYESQTTATFQHPNGQSWPAFISNWKQTYTPRKLDGEKVSIEFLEDQRANFLSATTAPSTQSTALTSSQAQLDTQLAALKASLQISKNDLNVFDSLRAASNAVASLSGTAQIYGGLLTAKAQELQGYCAQVDTLFSMQSPLAISILDPMHDIWASAVQITAAPSNTGTWVTPAVMSTNQIAAKLYGDASRALDIQQLNASLISDPYAVPAGTEIAYLLPSRTQ